VKNLVYSGETLKKTLFKERQKIKKSASCKPLHLHISLG